MESEPQFNVFLSNYLNIYISFSMQDFLASHDSRPKFLACWRNLKSPPVIQATCLASLWASMTFFLASSMSSMIPLTESLTSLASLILLSSGLNSTTDQTEFLQPPPQVRSDSRWHAMLHSESSTCPYLPKLLLIQHSPPYW